jgi:ribosomal-protein-alanine N-acetyltransferase
VIQPSLEYLKDLPIKDLGDIVLRPVLYEDYKDIYKYGSDEKVTRTLMWDTFKDLSEAIYSVKNVFLNRPEKGVPSAYAIVFKENSQMIGTCDIFKINWDTLVGEIGYVLNRDYWGRGYMTLTCKALLELGFNYLKLNKINIGHMIGNTGSRRVIEKCGFKYIKNKVHPKSKIEVKEYEMTKEDYQLLK